MGIEKFQKRIDLYEKKANKTLEKHMRYRSSKVILFLAIFLFLALLCIQYVDPLWFKLFKIRIGL